MRGVLLEKAQAQISLSLIAPMIQHFSKLFFLALGTYLRTGFAFQVLNDMLHASSCSETKFVTKMLT